MRSEKEGHGQKIIKPTSSILFYTNDFIERILLFFLKIFTERRRVSKKVKNGKNGKNGRKIWGVFDQKKSEGSWVQS